MPFWKKSEDPWDQPVRRPQPRPEPEAGAGTGQEENTAQELREMFRELGKGAREFFGAARRWSGDICSAASGSTGSANGLRPCPCGDMPPMPW